MITYDCIIIGGGIAGLTAALYAGRANLKTLVIESNQYGGQIVNSLEIENYPGYDSISGYDLINNIYNQVKKFDVNFLEDEVIELGENVLKTSKDNFAFKTAIIASGLKRRTLGLEKDFIGRGVSYCATCDGAFFKNKDVMVVGGGNTALEDALHLSNLANKVYLVHRRENFRADNSIVARVEKKDNIFMLLNRQVKEIVGDELVEEVVLDDDRHISINGLFVAIGLIPETEYLKKLIECDDAGFVISDDTTTNIPNIFVAGDIRTKSLRQLVTAASDGAIAAVNCVNYLDNNS